MTADLDAVINRFNTLLFVMISCKHEIETAKFTEHDLKEIIYLLGELKTIRQEHERGN